MRRTKLLGAALLATAIGAAQASCVRDDEPPPPVAVTPPPPTPEVPAFEPVPTTMRRLLKRQYTNAVRALFGAEAALAATPPDDSSVNGFDAIGARQLSVSDSTISAYESSARAVAAVAMKNTVRIADLLGCAPTGPTDAVCHTKLVKTLGRLAFRRPLTDAEITRYVAVAQSGATELGDFNAGVELVITAFLQSPSFLYMVEVGEPIAGGKNVLTEYELLARMSFFLLDAPPDKVLLDLVEKEGLKSDSQIRFIATSMLQRLDARTALGNFYAERYRLRDLDHLVKDADAFPAFSSELAHSMREETLRIIDDVIWERDTDVREMFTADYTFVNADLAALYGVKAPAGGLYEKTSMPAEHAREGILGHASFLARFSHTALTSPTLRGKFIREQILCHRIEPPPPDVVTSLPEDPVSLAKTMKEKLLEHQQNPQCAFCHKLMDPLGLAFEHFDAIGAYRETDNGNTLDTAMEDEKLGKFASPKELGALLRDDPNVAMCVVRNLYRNALGHLETEAEEAEVNELAFAFADAGFRVKDLLVEIVASPAFRIVGVPQ